jgi:protein HIRA/HIR1
VSVGLDSKVVVWSGHTFEKLKTLSNHQSHVKGITFDPANKYFATASDDRTIKIFGFTSPGPNSSAHDQMNNFILEATITAPFANSPLTTYFRRCSWAPDGQHIAAANAVNGPVSAIAIINRGAWDGDTTLIGHEGPVEVCAFSPRIYGRELSVPSADGHVAPHSTVIAAAGADKTLTVWSTSDPRPLVVLQEAALKPISDLAWSPDGMSVFLTALDGSIVSFVFEEGELGWPRSPEDTERSLTKFGIARKGAGVIETTEALLLEERSKEMERDRIEGRMGALMGDPQSSQPAADSTVQMNGDTTKTVPTNGNVTPATNGDIPAAAGVDPNQAKLEKLKSRVEITKDGKKRIKPLLVSGAGGAESSLPQSRLANAQYAAQSTETPPTILDLSKPFDGLPKGGLAALLLGNKRKLAQIEGDEEGNAEKRLAIAGKNGATPIVTNSVEGLVPAQVQPALNGQQPTPEFIRPAVLNPALTVSQLRLAVPKVRIHIVHGINAAGYPADTSSDTSTKSKAIMIFEARNPQGQSLTSRAQDREPCRITLSRKDQPLWQDFLQRPVILVTGNKDFWAAADENGSIHIWTPAGRRLVNALVMEAQPVILASYNSWLLCITAVGMCYVWNIKTMSSPHPPVSLAPVLDAAVHSLTTHPTLAPAVTNARLNSEGRIIISLSNGEGYAYSPQMYTWQRLSEVWWAVGSQYWNTTDSSVGNLSSGKKLATGDVPDMGTGIIPFLERNTTNETLLRGRAYFLQRLIKALLSREGFESFESGVSIAHLENRVAAALMLGSKEEFRLYLLMYAKRLGAEGFKPKVEELLRTLLGGIVEDDAQESITVVRNAYKGRNWQDDSEMLCGWKRDDLLKDVVQLLGTLLVFLITMCLLTFKQANTETFSV